MSDTGRLSATLAPIGITFPPLPYAPGRLSNGDLWVEYLAPKLGISDDPDPTKNTNFAYIGATSGEANVALSTAEAINGGPLPEPLAAIFNQLPGVQAQVNLFANSLPPVDPAAYLPAVDPNALYVVWGGANDFLTLLPNIASVAVDPLGAVLNLANGVLDAVGNIAQSVTTLADLGAATIVVPNIPNLGLTPLAAGQNLVPQATAFSVGFNLLLQGTLGALEGELGVDIVQVDVFSLVHDRAESD